MRVLADFHHDDLYESLRILFEDRMGWELYRPVGLEWFHEGYWNVFNHIDTATQYLGLHIGEAFEKRERESDNFPWMNKDHDGGNDGIYVLPKRGHNESHRGILLEKFKSIKFDIIVSSMPDHFHRFEELVRKHQPQAKHIFQMGNMWGVPKGTKNLLNSTTVNPGSNVNHVRYHQEFNRNIFKPGESPDVKSVINMQHYMHDKSTFDKLAANLPEWSFKAYGAGNKDDAVDVNILPEVIKNSGFVYHVKRGGEGYGYNIHHAYACGKPMIVNTSFFKGMTAHALFSHGEDCIDIGACSNAEAVKMMSDAAENYKEWSQRVHNKFEKVVDFKSEANQIKQFLEKLI